jgi:ATP-dependent Clp protease ATP-binding subunit ClpX
LSHIIRLYKSSQEELISENIDIKNQFLDMIKSIKKKNLMKKEILNKVSNYSTNIDVGRRVSTVLNSMEAESLESVAENMRVNKTVEEFRNKTALRIIKTNIDIPDPKDIFVKLSKNIIDQDQAVKVVSMAITKHFCRMKDSSIKKDNILLMGPTGTGKTELVKTLAKEINVPVVTVDASSFTSNGYKGLSVIDTIVNAIMSATKGDLELAKKCIVFIDEIDKKAAIHNDDHSQTTTAVQQELLTILQGDIVRTEKKMGLDTSNIMFIAAGAFSGIEKIVNKDYDKNSIGLKSSKSKNNKEDKDIFKNICNKDLVEYGFIPEFIGRFSTITYTKPLSSKSLIKILKQKTNSLLDQYNKIFKSFSIKVKFSPEFIKEVAEEAIFIEIGARGLERILDKKLENLLFNSYDYIGKNIEILKNGKVKTLN